jgi:flagellar basal-body rod protein FlgF
MAASGMVAEQTRQDQLANDLSNATTPGYKADSSPQHSFGEVLLANTRGGVPVGSSAEGVALGKTFTDLTPAAITETGEPLDFAIEGHGFFGVHTAQGVRYTRNGQFTETASGILTDANGNPVLSPSGGEVKVPATGTLGPGSVGIFELSGVEKQGQNLYTGTSAGKAQGIVRQGALESSGVEAATVMVEMISSLRSFQSGQQAIQAIGQTLQQASTQVGSLGSG